MNTHKEPKQKGIKMYNPFTREENYIKPHFDMPEALSKQCKCHCVDCYVKGLHEHCRQSQTWEEEFDELLNWHAKGVEVAKGLFSKIYIEYDAAYDMKDWSDKDFRVVGLEYKYPLPKKPFLYWLKKLTMPNNGGS